MPGFWVLHGPMVYGQRGWNLHPVGGASALPTSPLIMPKGSGTSGSGLRTDASKARV
jgi:hypothetical protein